VDPKTGTLELQASFPNPQHTLLPGQFGKVRVETDCAQRRFWCRSAPFSNCRAMQTVFDVAPDNKVELRAITTAERVGEDWIVQQGLKPGDRVIVEGQLKVRPGMRVTPTPYQPFNQARRRGLIRHGAIFHRPSGFAIVIAIVIVMLGIVAIPNLPIALSPKLFRRWSKSRPAIWAAIPSISKRPSRSPSKSNWPVWTG
jgi:hypothetical protein